MMVRLLKAPIGAALVFLSAMACSDSGETTGSGGNTGGTAALGGSSTTGGPTVIAPGSGSATSIGGGAPTTTGGSAPSGGAGPNAGGAQAGGQPTGGQPATGGSLDGGSASGGTGLGGTTTGEGVATGGVATGGFGTGGAETGGESTGGVETGGQATGGASTGGVETGGQATGGASTGGVETGGQATGGASTGGASGGDPPTGTMRVFYLRPYDVPFDQRYPDGIGNVMLDAQSFFQEQLGQTFRLNDPIVETVEGEHERTWYENTANGEDRYWWAAANAQQEIMRRFDLTVPDPRWMVVSEVSAEGEGAGGGATGGWVLLPGHDADGGAGYPADRARWVGGMVHELGHAFGLPDSTSTDGTCMSASFYGWPDCIFTQTQKDGMLNGNWGSGRFLF